MNPPEPSSLEPAQRRRAVLAIWPSVFAPWPNVTF